MTFFTHKSAIKLAFRRLSQLTVCRRYVLPIPRLTGIVILANSLQLLFIESDITFVRTVFAIGGNFCDIFTMLIILANIEERGRKKQEKNAIAWETILVY